MLLRIFLMSLYSTQILADPVDNPRTLVISNGGVIKLIVGLAMPVELPVGLVWVQNFQYQYGMIDKASQLTYLNLLRKSADRALTRNMTYNVLADHWNKFGMNGTDCVLRLICDVSHYSLSHNGILGQLLDTVFTPHQTSVKIFNDAMKLGRTKGKCSNHYPFCRKNILDYFIR